MFRKVVQQVWGFLENVRRIASNTSRLAEEMGYLSRAVSRLVDREVRPLCTLTVKMEGNTVLSQAFHVDPGKIRRVVFRPQLPLNQPWSFCFDSADQSLAVLAVMVGNRVVSYQSPYGAREGKYDEPVEVGYQLCFDVGPVE